MPLFSGENRRYLDGISESRQRILPPPSGSLPPSSSEESSAARRAGLPPAASLGDGSSGPAIAAFPLRRSPPTVRVAAPAESSIEGKGIAFLPPSLSPSCVELRGRHHPFLRSAGNSLRCLALLPLSALRSSVITRPPPDSPIY